jgi:hypothetical protein
MTEPQRVGEGAKVLRDHSVQLLLGRLMNSESREFHPIFDAERGYRYPEVEELIDDPLKAEKLLQRLVDSGILEKKICGEVLSCPNCGSSELRKAKTSTDAEGSTWLCSSCESLLSPENINYQEVYYYALNSKALKETSDHLFMAPFLDLLHKKGFKTESPGYLKGESEVVHEYDVVAYRNSIDDGVLVLDFEASKDVVGEERVISMFAKVYDTMPLKAILVVSPSITEKGWKLAAQYKIDLLEGRDVNLILKKLAKVIPSADRVQYRSLDAITLLSLPDHLRSTAMALNRMGEASADEIAAATGRVRAVESSYLNQLVRMGYIKKQRRERRVLFSHMY